MRRSAYLKALQEAAKLPEEIPEFARYFGQKYNPKLMAIESVKDAARRDNKLFSSELIDVLNWPEKEDSIKLKEIIGVCEEFLKAISYKEWRRAVKSVTANFDGDKKELHLGLIPFTMFFDSFKRIKNAKD